MIVLFLQIHYDYRDIARALEQGLNDEEIRTNLKKKV